MRRLIVVLFTLGALLPAPSAEEKRIAIYTPNANYSLPVTDRQGREYVGLLEVLGPLGEVNSRTDGLRWRVRYNDVDAEFTNGQNRAKIRGHGVDLTGPFLLENGRALVTVGSLGAVLARILSGPVSLNESSRRLFIGNVATHFTAQIARSTPPRLVMNFSAPVNPTLATEPGKLRMTFHREPIVPPGSPNLTFDDKTIPSATYSESNGSAEIAISGNAPLMASFSNEGRTITISAVLQQTASATPPPAAPGAAPSPRAPVTPSPAATPSAAAVVPPRRFYAVLDASHGGDDRGVGLSQQLAEKDVTLALARRIRQELESRGISTLVIRDSDVTVPFDQRAILANSAHPVIYISVHAAAAGRGVRLYTALMPAGGENNGPFVAWDTAQTRFLPLSQIAAQGVAAELQNRQIQARILPAPLRPLNNVTAAAVAVEVAPPDADVNDLNLAAYQQNVSTAVAGGILAVRDKLGVPQ